MTTAGARRIKRILEGQTESRVAPFLWLHGEKHADLLAEIDAIEAVGIHEFCIEARPHPDFGGPGWWRDLGFILTEAALRHMGVWLLDDAHFPTGWANGQVQAHHPELVKQLLKLKTFDVAGPVEGALLNLRFVLNDPAETVVAILAQRRMSGDTPDVAETVDLTPLLKHHTDRLTGTPVTDLLGNELPYRYEPCPVVPLDLGPGLWYVQVLTAGPSGGEKETAGYLNPLDPSATQVLIDTVYEPMWEHFSTYFGSTFKGFFSDEPRFGNIHGAEGASIGRNPAMPLPWRDDLPELLAARLEGTALAGHPVKPLLPLLFYGTGEEAAIMRFAYMDLVSELYSQNFDGVLAAWCAAHGVKKIGHVIEDNYAIARLGYGAGHVFRSMAHQAMGGSDVVFHQLMPGYDEGLFRSFHKPGWDVGFFAHVLTHLAGSEAHLEVHKGGDALAEVFGAYGWQEGNKLCKWIADQLFAGGVNFLVPHAFNPGAFPDPDCPPHFYNHGKNPQYPGFKRLMGYVQRVATLLSGGAAETPFAVLFNAEAEWAGAYSQVTGVARSLAHVQAGYDLVPCDALASAAADVGVDGQPVACIGAATYRSVVVPWSQALPLKTLTALGSLAQAGLPVWFMDGLPERSCEGLDAADVLFQLASAPSVRVMAEAALGQAAVEAGLVTVAVSQPCPELRAYHYRHSGLDVYFFAHAGASGKICAELDGISAGYAYWYDPFANTLTQASCETAPVPDISVPAPDVITSTPRALTLELLPWCSAVLLVSDEPLEGAEPPQAPFRAGERINLGACTVSFAPFELKCSEWGPEVPFDQVMPVSSMPGLEAFAGRIRYRFCIELTPEQAARRCRLELSGANEGSEVTVNGQPCGAHIVPGIPFALDSTLHPGQNELLVEVDTTLGRAFGEFIGQFMPMEATGISGATFIFDTDQG